MKRQNFHEYWESQIKDEALRNYVEHHKKMREMYTKKSELPSLPTDVIAEEFRKALLKALK